MRISYNQENKYLIVTDDGGRTKSRVIGQGSKVHCTSRSQLLAVVEVAEIITGNEFRQQPGTWLFIEQKKEVL